ncbi:O-antigen ligase family protein [Hymenobacter taeanensis]|uniref:O-antigen ligase family protein n=1 Tax=Hymenobacter taeanensis TaxID=2735321 RepID=A0A6M6BJ44_9BACT|nr:MULTISPECIES: O-antigen ligase family protein [Hymenobacter]QJX48070.1 O-antigen ligase family protein [Hymenobacter taeanensis]UOQ82472.1 O-antigen ligase family protein [Hymenobacter sp. 5414T-23]
MSELLNRFRPTDPSQRLFVGFMLLLMLGGATAALLETPLALLPVVLALGLLVVFTDWTLLFYLLFLTLAFSREFPVPGGLSLDVPSEPLMMTLTGCIMATLFMRRVRLPARELLHPVLVVLLLMLLWSVTSSFFSVDSTKSIKYILAKIWYLTPFILGTFLLVRRPGKVWQVARLYVIGTCLTVLIVIVRHAAHGFAFDAINPAVQPLYRNHVTYATVLALLLPFSWYGARNSTGLARLGWHLATGLLLFGLLTAYTRASILALPVAGIFYGVMRLRQTRLLLVGTLVGVLAGVSYFLSENNYMLYAPDFEKTVFNGKDFGKHLEATYKLQDMSGMERVYRWVAAARMTADKPLVGSGPSTFYPEYKRYTVRSFRTYVSDNPERSTTHNYFLLLLAEQGFPGMLLFVVLLGISLLMIERLYHRTVPRSELRYVVLACGLSFVIIVFHLLLNELVEVDKIGSFFFFNLAVLIRMGTWLKPKQEGGIVIEAQRAIS